jgi:tetratricopeptide (TPR) repeat protein
MPDTQDDHVVPEDPKATEAVWREALRLRPEDGEAHCRLGLALGRLGRFSEARDELERGHALGSRQANWRLPSADWLERARRAAALEAQVSDVLAGRIQPDDPIEQADLAEVAAAKGLEAQAVAMLRDAFATRAELVNDLSTGRRLRAACIAARAGMTQQALAWLVADLDAWDVIAAGRRPEPRQILRATLSRWKTEPDLAALRDEPVVDRLPEADRTACRALWARVDGLLQRARQ